MNEKHPIGPSAGSLEKQGQEQNDEFPHQESEVVASG